MKYKVVVQRVAYAAREIEIEITPEMLAEREYTTPDEYATELAIEAAGDYEFSEHGSDYNVDDLEIDKSSLTVADMMMLLKEKYPSAWFKDGAEFSDEHVGSVWSGEGAMSETKDVSLFSPTEFANEQYVMFVLRELDEFCRELGWYWESYDPGTFFLWRINNE
jgi:hypothetical protein